MTALFVLTVRSTSQQVLVRARCITCARNKAAEAAGGEGPMVWRDPELSACDLLRADGKPGVLMRGALM